MDWIDVIHYFYKECDGRMFVNGRPLSAVNNRVLLKIMLLMAWWFSGWLRNSPAVRIFMVMNFISM